MELSTQTQGQLYIVTVEETRIDAAVAIEFKDHMRAATEPAGDIVLLNLAQVEFIDSSGLGAIVAAMKFLSPQRRLILAGLTPTVDKVFRLTRMDSVFSLYNTLDEAIAEHGEAA